MLSDHNSHMVNPQSSLSTTAGITVEVTAQAADVSRFGASGQYFSYHIVITNERDDAVQLLRRHWDIIDGDGHVEEVDGDGVIGQQPTLEPGEVFSYDSFARLVDCDWGTMEGHYVFADQNNQEFTVAVSRFHLLPKQDEISR